MLSYDFLLCDEGSKTKSLQVGAWLIQRYEMGVGVTKFLFKDGNVER